MDGIVASSEFTSYVRSWFVKLYPYFHATWGILNVGKISTDVHVNKNSIDTLKMWNNLKCYEIVPKM